MNGPANVIESISADAYILPPYFVFKAKTIARRGSRTFQMTTGSRSLIMVGLLIRLA